MGASAIASRIRVEGARFVTLFILVLLLGVFARIWEFGSLPPGLRADETLAAVDAYDLYKFGVDHNGVSFPLVMIGGGSGASALYEYILIPSIAIGGMNPLAVRIPILLVGLLSMPIFFFVGKMIGGRRLGLIAMFVLAISPWHILASRRGHEAHLLPFVFLIAFATLLKSSPRNRWFVGASALVALCLYTYAPAYAAVPVFFVLAVAILLITGRVTFRTAFAGLAVFGLLATPIVLFVLINQLQLDTLHLGPFTIPRLPSKPRFEALTALSSPQPLQTLKSNAIGMASLLWKQSDGLPWNTVDPYGYFYRFTLPFAVVGAGLLTPLRDWRAHSDRLLVLAWLAAAASLGLFQPVNINRVNLIFMPLLLCIAMLLEWLWLHSRAALMAAAIALLIGYALFNREYHGARYREEADYFFYSGFLEAMTYARQHSDGPICVTNEGVDEPFVFALFLEKMNPADYLPDLTYENPRGQFRRPRRFGRYHFGVNPCEVDSIEAEYLLNQMESPPESQSYSIHAFGNFHVYSP